MSVLQQFVRRYLLVAPILLLIALVGLLYWVQPKASGVFLPTSVVPLLLLLAYRYRQYRQGNKKPFERMAYSAAIMLLTLIVLGVFTSIWA